MCEDCAALLPSAPNVARRSPNPLSGRSIGEDEVAASSAKLESLAARGVAQEFATAIPP